MTLLVASLVAFLLVLNRQPILDQLAIWQFHPSSEIVSITQRTGMSTAGIATFYESQPALESNQDFNSKCARQEQSTAILGCYTGSHIYIYNVTDPKIDGIREVTAAHEMLHAAYARMSDTERTQVNALLEAEYAKLKDNKDFAERMAFYARTEPGERDNEFHSIIGTEVASISPALEAHYKKYFDDRSKVVQLHTQYSSVFNDLQSRSQQLSDQLTTLGDTIEKSSASYNVNVIQLNKDIVAFNARANNNGFSSQADFQRERAALVARAAQLDTQRSTINDDVATYNKLRQELASIASQSDALNRSIDSSLAPAPSL
jgi:predicted  nucleic acid-binding Zn-ribbon protein